MKTRRPQSQPDDWPLRLAEAEWDFRKLEPWEINLAVYHEYSRQFPGEMKQASESLAKDCKTSPEGYTEIVAELARKFGGGIALAANLHFLVGMMAEKPWQKQPADVRARIVALFGKQRAVCQIADYPAPNSKYAPRSMAEIAIAFLPYQYGTDEDSNEWAATRPYRPSIRPYLLEIDWSAVNQHKGVDRLIAEIRKHLPNMRPPNHRKRGRQSISVETLTSLSALRLDRAGVSWTRAKKLVEQLTDGDAKTRKIRGLPDFIDERGWREAVRRAERFASDLFKAGN